MELDNTTYNDLSIFQQEEEFSIFSRVNFARTTEGREWLLKFFSNPFSELKHIQDTQQILKSILTSIDEWPVVITNGTIMVIEKFYDNSIDTIPAGANLLNALSYKFFHGPDFSLVRYSITHFADFVRGMQQLIDLLDKDESPLLIRSYLHRARDLVNKPVIASLAKQEPGKKFTPTETIYYGKFIKEEFKNSIFELVINENYYDDIIKGFLSVFVATDCLF